MSSADHFVAPIQSKAGSSSTRRDDPHTYAFLDGALPLSYVMFRFLKSCLADFWHLGLPAGIFENNASSPFGSVLDDALNKDYRDVVMQCAAEQPHPSDQLIDCVVHR